ncbi:hypothetical protein [Kitasatospora sp. NPDC088346]|uniref:hypothetical protein n=1 Tax=Kitasatospora sp. NPDC088346 TaxID=3364073 RepID=UPI00380F7872
MRRVSAVTAVIALATATALGGPARAAAPHTADPTGPAPRLEVRGVPQNVEAGGSARFSAELFNTTGADLAFHPAVRVSGDHRGLPRAGMPLRYRQTEDEDWHTGAPVPAPGDSPVLVPAGASRTLRLELPLPAGLEDGPLDFEAVAYWAPVGTGSGGSGGTGHVVLSGPEVLCVTPHGGTPHGETPTGGTPTGPHPSGGPSTAPPSATPTGPATTPSGSAAPSVTASRPGPTTSGSGAAVVLAATGGGTDRGLVATGLAFIGAGFGAVVALRRYRHRGKHTS